MFRQFRGKARARARLAHVPHAPPPARAHPSESPCLAVSRVRTNRLSRMQVCLCVCESVCVCPRACPVVRAGLGARSRAQVRVPVWCLRVCVCLWVCACLDMCV